MEFGILLRLVYVVLLIRIFFVHSVFKGENTTYVILLKTTIVFRHLQSNFFQIWSDDREH